jgi:predicted transposase YbfD/YdcC
LQRIDADAVDTAISSRVCRLSSGGAIGIDGKTARGACRPDGTQVHLLSAFLHQEGMTIAQREVPSKTNEIPEAKLLLDTLDLEGKVVTADALHT